MTAADKSVPFPVTFVSLDLETTGLNPESDRIIEVGAVRVEGGQMVDRFQRLINPGHALPDFVSLLTGITNADLVGAPAFADVATQLADFIGDLPMVGQNFRFDLEFLAAAGVRPQGRVFDTLALSRILRPSAANHGLGWLVDEMGIDNDSPHRALADAEATAKVFLAFWDTVQRLDHAILAMIHSLANRMQGEWEPGALFELAARERAVGASGPETIVRRLIERLGQSNAEEETRQRRLPTRENGAAIIGEVFGNGGGLRRALNDVYEPRPQQMQMAQAVLDVQQVGGTQLLEAPPGTGKSLGYLIPALWRAESDEEQVVVATSTRGLQEQLAAKDVPIALAALGLSTDEFRVAVLKGRGNYLCISRLLSRLSAMEMRADDVTFLARLLVWLEVTESGDLGELPMGEREAARWLSLSAGSEEGHGGCVYERQGHCFIGRARRAAQSAHLVITNHALLLADSATNGSVLGDVPHLILDEAHNLEREATDHYSRSVSASEVNDLLGTLGSDSENDQPRMVVSALARSGAVSGDSRGAVIAEAGTEVAAAARQAANRAGQLLQSLGVLIASSRSARGGDSAFRLTQPIRETEEWREASRAWEDMDMALNALNNVVDSRLRAALEAQHGRSGSSADVDDVVRRIADLRGRLLLIMTGSKRDVDITWVESPKDARRGISLHWAPMTVAPLLGAGPFANRKSIVLASATLTTEGSFGFICERLGLEEPSVLRLSLGLGSDDAAAAFVPMDIPEPNSSTYVRAAQQAIVEVATVTGGGVLALFTSHATLREAYTLVRPILRERDITVLGQGIDGPPDQLAEIARLRKRVVILGAAAFWEGVDLPGDALRALIVSRLPFDVPTDPIIAARGEVYENAFSDFQIPRSLLRFRQGVGRLLRSGRDQGVIVVLDSRVLNRGYGAAFIDALPTSTVLTPPLDRLGEEVREWFNADGG